MERNSMMVLQSSNLIHHAALDLTCNDLEGRHLGDSFSCSSNESSRQSTPTNMCHNQPQRKRVFLNSVKNKNSESGYARRNRNHQAMQRHKNMDIQRRVHGLMERFLSRESLFDIKPPDANWSMACNNSDMEQLNWSIWDVYKAKGHSATMYKHKLELWRTLYLHLKQLLPGYGLFLVGSTMNGLGLETSDVDMCLIVRPFFSDERDDAIYYLHMICNYLRTCDFIKAPDVIMAKVPILKFRDKQFDFEVDLNCNNSVGIRNTHLLNCYSRCDWRLRPLVIMVKVWAQINNINNAKCMTINSYSLVLMVIHYLQCGVHPAVLPCLQILNPDKFDPRQHINGIDVQEEYPTYKSSNKHTLGELLIGFLHYYAYFDYAQYAISIRDGRVLLIDECRLIRSPKNDHTQWKLLCIQEPFDCTNTARCVYDKDVFKHIVNVFRASYEILMKTKCLYKILPLYNHFDINYNNNQQHFNHYHHHPRSQPSRYDK